MFKKYIPFAHAKSIYEIPVEFYIQNNFKYIFVDLDNTLDSYKLYEPSTKAFNLVKNLKEKNIELIIISNNRGKRVSTYAKNLNVNYLSFSKKPFAKKINQFIVNNNYNKNDIVFIGDQMLTDVGCAANLGIKVILTDKLVKEDQITTKFNRIFDKFVRHYHKKRNNLKDWSDYYGNKN